MDNAVNNILSSKPWVFDREGMIDISKKIRKLEKRELELSLEHELRKRSKANLEEQTRSS